jgi:hypothetical protein
MMLEGEKTLELYDKVIKRPSKSRETVPFKLCPLFNILNTCGKLL